ncbi:hypothetical protein [Pararhodobacter sp. CCB-MM2]|uniref:hypothetical protein n=1 Tax=Pararhodobacter sp. CCB-MM2 TaxID=1786003 RepID=UPI000830453B|nr:hypothetical protein [Pararhodobacter sp. CCB-MM2]
MPASSLVLRLGTAFGLHALTALVAPALPDDLPPRPAQALIATLPALSDPQMIPQTLPAA